MALSDILGKLEGIVDPKVLESIATDLADEVKNKEQEFVKAAEDKYGAPPALVSDVKNVIEDAAPVAEKAVEDAVPPGVKSFISDLMSQLEALKAQVNALKAQPAANQTTSVMGQGEPVSHTLFLEDGSVVKNHGGVATHYSIPDPNNEGQDIIKRVVAAYPTA